jgi:hypothetical protein
MTGWTSSWRDRLTFILGQPGLIAKARAAFVLVFPRKSPPLKKDDMVLVEGVRGVLIEDEREGQVLVRRYPNGPVLGLSADQVQRL